jgi:hypothetical protein
MSARLEASSVVYLPSVVDEKFLKNVADVLERLRSESELRGHPFLASLLAITKGEAEDDLRTRSAVPRRPPSSQDEDDGIAEMAQKLAWRTNRRA